MSASDNEAVLVTGGSGFIGRHLVRALCDRGDRVHCVIRPGRQHPDGATKVFEGSILDADLLAAVLGGVSTVYHLGGVGLARITTSKDVNEGSVAALVAACRRSDYAPRRIVFTSSIKAIAPRRDAGGSYSADPYAAAKRRCEAALQEVEGRSVQIVRLPAVYGPGDRNFLPAFRLCRRGVLPTLAPGDDVLHDIAFVGDVVSELTALGDQSGPQRLPCVLRVTWDEFARTLGSIADRAVRHPTVPRAVALTLARMVSWLSARRGGPQAPIRHRLADMLEREWAPQHASTRATPLAAGLRRTWRGYEADGWL